MYSASYLRSACVAILIVLAASCQYQGDTRGPKDDVVTISIVGTNDIHGQFLPYEDRGGITTLSGYVAALRKARAADGSVLLVDGGDMWQGSLESNLNEGALMVEAFNALGYAASTIGNHEFDFGPVGERPIPVTPEDDPRGALKTRAAEMQFPLLAANLIDESTGELVAWDNVRPSTMVEVAGVRIGIIGVLTRSTPATTIPANTVGLRFGSLSDAIIREATRLRKDGAEIVVVTAHAGGRCDSADDPHDLSVCNLDSEIFRTATALPPGLVDYINGGHEAFAIAHEVNGIAITASHSYGRTMSRVDIDFDRASGTVRDLRIFPPQPLCPMADPGSGGCIWPMHEDRGPAGPAKYEGRPVIPDPAIAAIAERAAARAAEIKLEELGVTLATRFTLEGNPESSLANLVMRALHESIDADVAILNVQGGLRSDLPAGALNYGHLFQMFPFDNRIAVIEMSGADLRRVIASQVHRGRRRPGLGGMSVAVDCRNDRLQLTMTLDDGRVVGNDDRIHLAANDFLALGGDRVLNVIRPEAGFDYPDDPRLVRDVIAGWLRGTGGTLHADDFKSEGSRRWMVPEALPATCSLE